MIQKGKQYCRQQAFKPSLLGLFINPFFFARAGLYRHIKDISQHGKGDLLDIGCGRQPYRHLFDVTSYVGVELDNERNRDIGIADIYYDGVTLPVDDKQFNTVLCNQVLEHVFTQEKFVKEIYRVLKKEGVLILTIPFMWDEHEQPFDNLRYTSFGLTSLLQEHGFTVLEMKKSQANFSAIVQLANCYFYKQFTKLPFPLRALLSLIICGSLNIIGGLLSVVLPSNNDLYLDNIVVAKKSS